MLRYHRALDRATQCSHAKKNNHTIKATTILYLSARGILSLYTIFQNENGSLLQHHYLKGFPEEKHSKPQTFCLHTEEFNKPQAVIKML